MKIFGKQMSETLKHDPNHLTQERKTLSKKWLKNDARVFQQLDRSRRSDVGFSTGHIRSQYLTQFGAASPVGSLFQDLDKKIYFDTNKLDNSVQRPLSNLESDKQISPLSQLLDMAQQAFKDIQKEMPDRNWKTMDHLWNEVEDRIRNYPNGAQLLDSQKNDINNNFIQQITASNLHAQTFRSFRMKPNPSGQHTSIVEYDGSSAFETFVAPSLSGDTITAFRRKQLGERSSFGQDELIEEQLSARVSHNIRFDNTNNGLSFASLKPAPVQSSVADENSSLEQNSIVPVFADNIHQYRNRNNISLDEMVEWEETNEAPLYTAPVLRR